MTTIKDRANQLVLAPWFEYRIIAVSVPLLIGCWSQPAMAALAIVEYQCDDGLAF
ncbi:MAG: hypothetical protein H0X47_04145 [Nitrospirales bacterium]|nr:hypothetical protein [Nitrospirales bacterium]